MKAQKSRHAEIPEAAEEGAALHAGVAPPGPPGRHRLVPAQPPGSGRRPDRPLLGTTKATIDQVRNRTHWNSANIKPVDPVTLGLSTQLELDAVVKKAAEKKAKDDKRKGIVEPEGPTLLPASETGASSVVDDEPEDTDRRRLPDDDDWRRRADGLGADGRRRVGAGCSASPALPAAAGVALPCGRDRMALVQLPRRASISSFSLSFCRLSSCSRMSSAAGLRSSS